MGNVKEIEPFNFDEIIQLIKYSSDDGLGKDITGELNTSVKQNNRRKMNITIFKEEKWDLI